MVPCGSSGDNLLVVDLGRLVVLVPLTVAPCGSSGGNLLVVDMGRLVVLFP